MSLEENTLDMRESDVVNYEKLTEAPSKTKWKKNCKKNCKRTNKKQKSKLSITIEKSLCLENGENENDNDDSISVYIIFLTV